MSNTPLTRRSFLQTAAGTAAATAAMGWIPAASHARMRNLGGSADTLNIAVIGTGG